MQLLPLRQFLGSTFSLAEASNDYALDDDAALMMTEVLAGMEWEETVLVCGPYSVRRHSGWDAGQDVGLFHDAELVGFYDGPNLWVHPDHRGKGLSTPLILAAASLRGGQILPEGVTEQGYSPAGLLSHASAHLHSVIADAKAGRRISDEVLREYGLASEHQLLTLFPDQPVRSCQAVA